MEIAVARKSGALVASVSGRIDGTNSKEFEDGLKSEISDDESIVVLDLENLTYISSAGLRAILLTAKHLGRRNAKFRISSVSPSVSEIFTVSGFDRIIPIFKTQDAAVEAKD